MPHNHIFMDQLAVDEYLVTTDGGYHVCGEGSIEGFVARIVQFAFQRHAGEELADDQVVQYPIRITNSMPADVNVNITAWYTPERAPHLDAIEREVLVQLKSWAPALDIEVHLVAVGAPK